MLDIRIADGIEPGVPPLCKELDAYYIERFGSLALQYQPMNRLEQILFSAAAYDGDRPVACLCAKAFDRQTIELKRLYVQPPYRRQGTAKELLAKMEQRAKGYGCISLVLETGSMMHEVIALYESIGFSPCEAFSLYKGDDVCYCMKKSPI